MRILILGNGFDLAHKLPTRYTDFLDYIIKNAKTDSRMNTLIKDNVWIRYFIQIYTMNLAIGNNWIDFESEISHILKTFDNIESNINNRIVPLSEINNDKKIVIFYNIYANVFSSEGIVGVTKRTYLSLIYNLELHLDNLIMALELYLIESVEKVKIKFRSYDIEAVNATNVISFNYTHTYERLYADEKTKIHHIHGNVNEEKDKTNNMVLGVDEYWEIKEAHKHTNYNIFKKFTQRIIKETGFAYREWIKESVNNIKFQYKNVNIITDVFIFGHSLDITDSDIIKEFFDKDCFRVHIYYVDKKTEASLISNVIKMIGEEEFIRQINLIPPKIEFIRQKDMTHLEC